MSIKSTTHEATSIVMPRRSLLKAGGVGVGALILGGVSPAVAEAGGDSVNGRRRHTQDVVRRLLASLEGGNLAEMWTFFDHGGVVFHPFTGTRVTDFAGFQAAFGGFFAIAEGLQFSE